MGSEVLLACDVSRTFVPMANVKGFSSAAIALLSADAPIPMATSAQDAIDFFTVSLPKLDLGVVFQTPRYCLMYVSGLLMGG